MGFIGKNTESLGDGGQIPQRDPIKQHENLDDLSGVENKSGSPGVDCKIPYGALQKLMLRKPYVGWNKYRVPR